MKFHNDKRGSFVNMRKKEIKIDWLTRWVSYKGKCIGLVEQEGNGWIKIRVYGSL